MDYVILQLVMYTIANDVSHAHDTLIKRCQILPFVCV